MILTMRVENIVPLQFLAIIGNPLLFGMVIKVFWVVVSWYRGIVVLKNNISITLEVWTNKSSIGLHCLCYVDIPLESFHKGLEIFAPC